MLWRIVCEVIFPIFLGIIFTQTNNFINNLASKIWTTFQRAKLCTRHLMSLNNKLCLIHVVCIWVRIKIPHRYVRYLRDCFEEGVIVSLIIPIRILLVNSKWPFNYPRAKQRHFKRCATEMFVCA